MRGRKRGRERKGGSRKEKREEGKWGGVVQCIVVQLSVVITSVWTSCYLSMACFLPMTRESMSPSVPPNRATAEGP